MSHAVVAPPCFPTVRSAANRPRQRANTKRNRSSGGAALGFGGERKEVRWKCVEDCGACCKLEKGPSFATPEEILQDPSDVQASIISILNSLTSHFVFQLMWLIFL
ncbi:hypothetical protein ACSBR2_034948 [Camellia fascicularis]